MPDLRGKSLKLPAKETNAIIHYNINNVDSFLERLQRYTKAETSMNKDYLLSFAKAESYWQNEFAGRYFHQQGFKRVLGVELDPGLCEIARKNMKRLNIEGVSILNKDATLIAEELDIFNYFYLYNPFDAQVMRSLLSNIEDSINKYPREIYIAYLKPVHRKVFDRAPFLRIIKETERYLIYEVI